MLDVGCGEGARLEKPAKLGFANLTGIDAFLPQAREGRRPSGITLIRGELNSHDRKYDCITMHHSLEHVPDPKALLETARASESRRQDIRSVATVAGRDLGEIRGGLGAG
ncbi:MAG: methyltransferase domain-containing protein [Proteobacteria bacterium]|nr:methyltransferase domain-containing protein [Pseudomonadota bacterium]MDA0913619.1 methyltransferase domain-containing protein [Pseudomonadota bacterium]MDA1032510.1 methyltransferase domain-containing protein [Pseudomonadota bacterium]